MVIKYVNPLGSETVVNVDSEVAADRLLKKWTTLKALKGIPGVHEFKLYYWGNDFPPAILDVFCKEVKTC